MPFILRIKTIKILTPGVPVLGPDLRTKSLQVYAPPTNQGLVYYGSKGLTAGVRRALAAGMSDKHETPSTGELDIASLRFDAVNAGDEVNLLYYQWQDEPDPLFIFPNQLAGLGGWWKADAITGLANNAPVSSWVDSSGNNKPLLAAGSLRPLYKTNVQAGLPGVLFDGLQTMMNVQMQYSAPTIFWVSSLTQGGQIYWSDGAGATELIGGGLYPSVSVNRGGTQFLEREFQTTWMNGLGVFSVRFSDQSVALPVRVRRDGKEVVAVGETVNNQPAFNFLARDNYIGSLEEGDNAMGGHLLEMIVFTVPLSESEVAGIEFYLSDKWGI